MRRKDREVSDRKEIKDILERCQVLRLGVVDETGAPYVLPVNFAVEETDHGLALWFHTAKEGRLPALLNAAASVCAEADIFHGYQGSGNQITTLYESVIGWGRAQLAADDATAAHGAELLMARLGNADFDGMSCAMLHAANFYCLTLTRCTGKRNL